MMPYPMDQYSLFQHFLRCYTQHYADFKARARRREYWGFTLFYSLIFCLLYGLMVGLAIYTYQTSSTVLLFVTAAVWVIWQIVCAGSMIPSLAVSIRRLHDTGRSGWWVLLAYVPMIAILVLGICIQQVVTLGGFLVTRPLGLLWACGVVYLLFMVGAVWLLVLFCRKSIPGENAYGPCPLEPQSLITDEDA